MSDTSSVVMNQGIYPAHRAAPEDIYNEPENAFVADFHRRQQHHQISLMVEDKLVEILGVTRFPCVDTGFGRHRPVDVVIRPEDVVAFGRA